MALNVGKMLEESAEALGADNQGEAINWMETWVPQIVNEINDLRNQLVLQETRITELEGDLEAMGG